jgi:uncharacterized coiled-coil protein SlyX
MTPILGGPFQNEKEFVGFLGAFIDPTAFNEDENKVPLFFGKELNFRISCTGVVGNMTREIEGVVYDAFTVKARLKETLQKDLAELEGKPNCQDYTGDQLYECLCQDRATATEKQQCITQKKKDAQKSNQTKNQKQPLPPGPPRMIIQQIK